MTTIEFSGTFDDGTKTVKVAVTRMEEDFTNNPINFQIPQLTVGSDMKTILVDLLKTKNTFTIHGKIGYNVDGTNNTWKCYCDLRDLSGAETLAKNTLVTMTVNTTATVTSAMKYRYPRDGTTKTFTGLIMKSKITMNPQDNLTSGEYDPDNTSAKEAQELDVIITFQVGQLSGT